MNTPELSIVIASVNGYGYISQCLDSLARQEGRERAEVLVAECSGDDTAQRLVQEYPWVEVFPFDTPVSIPKLRAIGIRQAKADIVVTTEDHCVFDEDWYDTILAAHRAHPEPAIGGAVENGSRDRMVDWAAYICEYGKFMRPFPASHDVDLPGPNVSYKRKDLESACSDLLDRGEWENVLHERMASRGMELRKDPSIVVHHAKRFGFWEFLEQRYYFGRSFAANRIAQGSSAERLMRVATALLLPPLFLWRYASYFISKKRFVAELVKTSPLLVIFAVGWSVGEFLGYAFGDGGASLRVK